MTRASRYVYLALAWAFLAGLVVQVFFAGLGLFVDQGDFGLHVNLGWILHLLPVLVLAAAALSRAGRRHWQWALALAVVVFIVPILATLRGDMPLAAAFHPVGALLAFWLAIVVARNSLEPVRAADAPGASTPPEAPATG